MLSKEERQRIRLRAENSRIFTNAFPPYAPELAANVLTLLAELEAAEAERDALREAMNTSADLWTTKAIASREEAGRIRRTIKAPTDAESNCYVRAEVWDGCAARSRAALEGKPDV